MALPRGSLMPPPPKRRRCGGGGVSRSGRAAGPAARSATRTRLHGQSSWTPGGWRRRPSTEDRPDRGPMHGWAARSAVVRPSSRSATAAHSSWLIHRPSTRPRSYLARRQVQARQAGDRPGRFRPGGHCRGEDLRERPRRRKRRRFAPYEPTMPAKTGAAPRVSFGERWQADNPIAHRQPGFTDRASALARERNRTEGGKVDPGKFGRAAADVDHQRPPGAWQRSRHPATEIRPLPGAETANRQPRSVSPLAMKFGPVGRRAAGLGRPPRARAPPRACGSCRRKIPARRGARSHGPSRAAGLARALPQSHDAREGIDDPISPRPLGWDQQAQLSGAQVEAAKTFRSPASPSQGARQKRSARGPHALSTMVRLDPRDEAASQLVPLSPRP